MELQRLERWTVNKPRKIAGYEVEMEESNESALEFLQNLETRHSLVLDDLDALNTRIESILESYSQSRKPDPSAGSRVTE